MLGLSLSLTRAALPQAFAELNLLSPTLDPRITFTRASTKTYTGSDGLLHTAAVNECPLEYDPVTLLPVGRSFWEARTNLLLNSATLATQNVTTSATTYTLSFTGTGTVTLSGAATGTLTGTGTGPANRVSLTVTATAGTLTLTVTGTVTNANLEPAATPGPYIATTSAQVTRAADVATVNDLSTIRFNPVQGTLYAEYSLSGKTTNASIARFDDGTDSNYIWMRYSSGGAAQSTGGTAGVTDFSLAPSSYNTVGAFYKRALAYSANGAQQAINGVLPNAAAGAFTPPTGMNELNIGKSRGSAEQLCGPIRRFRYYPRKLSDTELQALTT